MSPLDGADPKKFEAVPEVSSSHMGAVSGPGSRDSFQGLDLTEPGWGVKMRVVVCKGKYICSLHNLPGTDILVVSFLPM